MYEKIIHYRNILINVNDLHYIQGEELTSIDIGALGFFALCSEEQKDRIKAITILDKYLEYLYHVNINLSFMTRETFDEFILFLKRIVMNYNENDIDQYYDSLDKFLKNNTKDCIQYNGLYLID